MIKTPSRTCMHCDRPFVFNDLIRFFSRKEIASINCDICEETNYFTDQKHKPILLVISLILGAISTLPVILGSIYVFWPFLSSGQSVGIIFFLIPFIGLIVTSALLRVIYRHYVWQTHTLSKRFESPFLDNLNR